MFCPVLGENCSQSCPGFASLDSKQIAWLDPYQAVLPTLIAFNHASAYPRHSWAKERPRRRLTMSQAIGSGIVDAGQISTRLDIPPQAVGLAQARVFRVVDRQVRKTDTTFPVDGTGGAVDV